MAAMGTPTVPAPTTAIFFTTQLFGFQRAENEALDEH